MDRQTRECDISRKSRHREDTLGGSARDEQDDLANNFDSFISSAVGLDTDYNLGVVNTDSESEWAGKLHHCNDSNRFIQWTQPATQQQNQFACWARTTAASRPNSDNKESPLQAARLALADDPHPCSEPVSQETAPLAQICSVS